MTALITRQFRVFRGPSAVVDAIGPNVLALAGFDGVHTGHRELLGRAVEEATKRGLPVGAATLDVRHARQRKHGVPVLTTLGDRIRLLRDAGMDFVVLFPSNPGAIGVPEEIFTGRILFGIMQSQLVIIRGRTSTPTAAGGTLDVEVLPVVRITSNRWVSTTRIRDLLGRGDIKTVNQLMGRRYELTATVDDSVSKQVRARVSASRLAPAAGTYRVEVQFQSDRMPATVETVCTVAQTGSDTTELVLLIDLAIDHGRLRVSFVATSTTVIGRPCQGPSVSHRVDPTCRPPTTEPEV